MELFERQYFDQLLDTAVERYVERLEQRNEGAGNALERLRSNREGTGVWFSKFIDTLFEEFLIDNAAGACFVLQALASRPAPKSPLSNGTVEAALLAAAKEVFSELFYQKTLERLEQHSSFQATYVDH